ncbi:hypothetical protein HELRODRAFT_185907 [Helobdella robusta]|uniref:t-SNARE coiled-coil homology domain-containing protein n=1 Tax=Helobdella robusta TaxID=6412 RepID=T1FNF4_HELRO|nr:hypothetical protein HELRODRAFT_185907 [Helobdella robusta]ESN97557.1 hypothetical protein HELRODRAFT_185907 [Helobdella robusta]
MATRSLTEAFVLMRNNALQNKHLFSDQHNTRNEDKKALVSKDETDVELGNSADEANTYMSTQWSSKIEEVQLEVSRINAKIRKLSELHDKHLNRPTMDDNIHEERQIEALTHEITTMFHRCQKCLREMAGMCRVSSGKQASMGQNVVSMVARKVQDLSITFRSSQSAYLKKLQGREERHSQYLTPNVNLFEFEENPVDDFHFTSVQRQAIEEDSILIEQREKEILQIVRSIQDLNEIFKELAVMIVDQGTILDRIDYNIEKSAEHVESGLVQLQKAEKYQKKNRKMHCIVILFLAVIILLVILVAIKS